LKGQGAITPELALRLELVFQVSAQSWLAHQSAYELWQMEARRQELSKQVQPFHHNQAF
jgi:addiction module HigA family antidote